MIKEQIKKDLKEAVEKSLGIKVKEIHLEHPANPEHGDYASNIALTLAKKLGKTPMNIASVIAQFIARSFDELRTGSERELKFATTNIDRVEVAPPGFINFYLSQKFFVDELKRVLNLKDRYGSSKIGKGKTIIIDYSSPNIAKPFGVGHLRSTIIGQALYNLYKILGYKVIGDNHLGDWGTQFGKLIYAIKTWGNEKKIAQNPIKELNTLYIKFHGEAAAHPELEEEGRLWFKKLEEGDKEARRLWKKCVDWGLEEFDRIYKILGVKIDLTLGESFYESMLKGVIKEALDKGVAEESEGAIIIRYPSNKLPPYMIQKSDEATLYSTRDLATIKYRRENFKPYRIIYEVGTDQTLHFKQLFWAAELLGWGKRKDYFHVAHGMMRLPKGRMRTRRGEVVLLEGVLAEAVERARKIVEESNPDLSQAEKDKIAKAVGIGAVKYNDLSQHYSTDIIFDWEKMLNLKGNSGPYLQYTHARARSILRKSQGVTPVEGLLLLREKKEVGVMRLIYQFPEVVGQAAESYSPNFLCNYLFDLAQNFNTFYESVPVLQAKNEDLKKARLALVFATAQILKNGLNLLGILAPERM